MPVKLSGLIGVLEQQGEAAMRATPALQHEWVSEGQSLVLRIPAISSDGFDVELEANADGLELRCGDMHTSLDVSSDPATAVRDALGLVRDVLTTGMRLRELTAGGTPYRWLVEATTEHGWKVEHTMGLIFWNYFGRRSERIYCNDHLPARQL